MAAATPTVPNSTTATRPVLGPGRHPDPPWTRPTDPHGSVHGDSWGWQCDLPELPDSRLYAPEARAHRRPQPPARTRVRDLQAPAPGPTSALRRGHLATPAAELESRTDALSAISSTPPRMPLPRSKWRFGRVTRRPRRRDLARGCRAVERGDLPDRYTAVGAGAGPSASRPCATPWLDNTTDQPAAGTDRWATPMGRRDRPLLRTMILGLTSDEEARGLRRIIATSPAA